MNKKIDELKNMQSNTPYFKEIEQVGRITGQIYHLKFKTEDEYKKWLMDEEKIKSLSKRLENL
jgi:hypothetical protein